MNYRLLSYSILRIDGGVTTGLIPYRGIDESPETLGEFVARYLDYPEASYQTLSVEILKHYDSEHEWIIDVHQLRAFNDLQKEKNYAGDLLMKYDLPTGHEL
jgi:hypothetical protein